LACALASGLTQATSPEAAALFQQGSALREKGDLPGALDRFRRAARLDPALPHVHREIGLILVEQRDFSGAAAEFRKVVETDPGDFQSGYNLALALANGGRVPEGREEIRRLLRSKPRWAMGFYGLGHIEVLAGNVESAVQAFRTALSLDPDSHRTWFELGKLLADQDDREGAIQAFQSAVRLQPDSAPARHRLAVLLQKTGQSGPAAEAFAAARALREKRLQGEQAAAAYRNGIERLENSDYPAAAAELERAAGLRPDFPETRAMLAHVHEQWGAELESGGDVKAALSHYHSAVTWMASAETLNHLGVLLARAGQLDAAIDRFREALKLDSGFRNAEQNLRQALALKAAPH
jgi:tetratricopeptide (TPR) repeat protein